MRRVIIVVEGQTEEEFVKYILLPYFQSFGIYDVRPIKVETSPGHKGGITDYHKFKRDVVGYLRKEKSVIVTSLIDYFRLPGDFPDYEEVTALHNVVQIVTGLEAGLKKDIGHPLFLPYIQLHEFEALLFTNIKGFVDVAEISPKKVG